MLNRFKTFVQEANMGWHDVVYILIIGGLLMWMTYRIEHWGCN